MLYFFKSSLRNYLFLSFAKLFFTFFVVLFFISSIVTLIGIAGVTFVIKISALDLATLYLYSLPSSLFFILPISFFTSAVLTLSKLSYDYELLVFFSLGLSPSKILLTFLPITLLLSLILLVFSLTIAPLSNSAYKNFIDEKKSNVDVNIKPGEFGQKLGEWLVYVDGIFHEDKEVYTNLVLYSNTNLQYESFILAREGEAGSNNNVFEINLNDGVAYFADTLNVKKVLFNNMKVRNKISESVLRSYDLINYWAAGFNGKSKKIAQRFARAVLISLFPLMSIFLILTFGIANPRFQKNLSYLYIIVSIVLFYVLSELISNVYPPWGIPILCISWLLISYLAYMKLVLKYY